MEEWNLIRALKAVGGELARGCGGSLTRLLLTTETEHSVETMSDVLFHVVVCRWQLTDGVGP